MRAIDDPGWFNYHKILAQDMLVVVIAVVFAVVAPIVLIPCALFFFLSRIVWTHQYLYVFESAFETGGELNLLLVDAIYFYLYTNMLFVALHRSILAQNLPALCLWIDHCSSHHHWAVYSQRCSPRGICDHCLDVPDLLFPSLHKSPIRRY